MALKPPSDGYILRVVYREGGKFRAERHEFMSHEHRWANSAFKDFAASGTTISVILSAPGGRVVSQFLRGDE